MISYFPIVSFPRCSTWPLVALQNRASYFTFAIRLHIFQSRGAVTSKENGLQALKHAIPGWHIHIQELSAYYTLEYNSPITPSNLPGLYNALSWAGLSIIQARTGGRYGRGGKVPGPAEELNWIAEWFVIERGIS